MRKPRNRWQTKGTYTCFESISLSCSYEMGGGEERDGEEGGGRIGRRRGKGDQEAKSREHQRKMANRGKNATVLSPFSCSYEMDWMGMGGEKGEGQVRRNGGEWRRGRLEPGTPEEDGEQRVQYTCFGSISFS